MDAGVESWPAPCWLQAPSVGSKGELGAGSSQPSEAKPVRKARGRRPGVSARRLCVQPTRDPTPRLVASLLTNIVYIFTILCLFCVVVYLANPTRSERRS